MSFLDIFGFGLPDLLSCSYIVHCTGHKTAVFTITKSSFTQSNPTYHHISMIVLSFQCIGMFVQKKLIELSPNNFIEFAVFGDQKYLPLH